MLKEMNDLRFGEFTLDRHLRELRRGDAVLPVQGKAFDLLSFMAANPGRPLTKAELLDAVWPDTAVEESNLTQHVFQLRKVMASGADGPIKTLTGRGYQFVAEVAEIEALPKPKPAPAPAPTLAVEATATRVVLQHSVEEESDERSAWLPARGWWLAAAALLLALAGALGWHWRQRWLDRSGGAPVQVVLVPLAGTTGDAVLDKALTQALRMDLAQSPYVTLVPVSTVAARLKEMGRKPDEPMATETAREVCERTNSQSVLSGNIARIGQGFLVTAEASNCVDGAMLGQAKYEAARAEDLPRAIDKLAADLRQKLGESRRSIARFSAPLFQVNTPSLEALKAFTQGTQLGQEGKIPEAIALLKTAVAADPNFAAAHYNLAAAYGTVGDDLHEREAIAKAYSLKDTAGKQIQYGIMTMYEDDFTGDLYQLLRDYQSWADLYPESSQAWSGLSNTQRLLGMNAEALASQQRVVALLPHSQGMLANLAMGQTRAGDLKGARATCERAIHDNLDGDGLRARYLQLAYLLRDRALLEEQRAWEKAHPQAFIVLGVERQIAMAEGRFADARALIAREREIQHQQGFFGPDDERMKFAAVDLMQTGDLEAGKKMFLQSPVDTEEGQEVLGLVYAGNLPAAQAAVQAQDAKYPQATMRKLFWSPRTRAAIAMAQHRPADAAALLEIARPLDGIVRVLPWSRGNAYLAAGQPELAEKNYRSVIEHPELEPDSPYISLSWLGLGEALAAQGKRPEAIAAYQHFFALWAHADADAPHLKLAKEEFAQLQTTR
jgi:DNA-binding winged helix-turn-helix (wHTH) protein/tetratricopeptide (TPR) repeat protein